MNEPAQAHYGGAHRLAGMHGAGTDYGLLFASVLSVRMRICSSLRR